MGRKVPLLTVLCLLLVPAGALAASHWTDGNSNMNYESHEPISIWGDAQFASLADEEGWSGMGTHELPYIIEGYQIQSSGCITIGEVDCHFVVRNCHLSSGGDGYGVSLHSVSNGCIESCTICSVWQAIVVWSSSGVVIYNNTLYDAEGGVLLSESPGCTVGSNHFTNCSLEVWARAPDQWLHNVTTNYVNEKPLGYFREQSEMTIDAALYGQVMLALCQYVRVQNGVFCGTSNGIALGYCQDCIIVNCNLTDNWIGVYVDHSDEGLINDCQIRDSTGWGIQLNQSLFWNVSSNEMSWNYASGVVAMDSSLILQGSNISHSETGVMMVNCSQSTLWDNEISYNVVGASAIYSRDVCFEANTFSHNSDCGLELSYSCTDCQVYNNRFFDNGVENARDNGGPNTWDNGYGTGNYWSDYLGEGVYNIPGIADSVDRFPRQLEYTGNVTSSSSTTTTPSNTTGVEIPVIISASVTVGSVAVIMAVGYVLLRGRGPRGYQ